MFEHKEEHLDDHMMIIQANIDDMNPELTSHLSDLLFASGANDVYLIPILMKKGRPGVMLNILVDQSLLSKMEAIIFRETTTFGLRYYPVTCHRLARKWVSVKTMWGEVEIKVGYYQDKRVQFAPEYSQCEAIANQHKVPLKEVYDQVRHEYMKIYPS